MNRLFSLIAAGIGWALFYFGSWHLVLGKKISFEDQFLKALLSGDWSINALKKKDVIFDSGILIRINEKFYGIIHDAVFFDSPFIQYMMLMFSIGAFYVALKILITGDI